MGNELDTMVGKTANVYVITETMNERGDVTKATSSTTSAVCEIQVLSGDEREVRSGVLQPLDAIGFFKPSDNVQIGDEVSYQSNLYEVVGLFKEQLGTVEVFHAAHLKRILS
jgi:hypothetical protein